MNLTHHFIMWFICQVLLWFQVSICRIQIQNLNLTEDTSIRLTFEINIVWCVIVYFVCQVLLMCDWFDRLCFDFKYVDIRHLHLNLITVAWKIILTLHLHYRYTVLVYHVRKRSRQKKITRSGSMDQKIASKGVFFAGAIFFPGMVIISLWPVHMHRVFLWLSYGCLFIFGLTAILNMLCSWCVVSPNI